mmetsp:Transcript_8970/g.37052  ORF Transcript_8970/g.37052 Transcript_8970/m.37052 type:complete len:235 (-) Transcript_8970:117-821(-)
MSSLSSRSNSRSATPAARATAVVATSSPASCRAAARGVTCSSSASASARRRIAASSLYVNCASMSDVSRRSCASWYDTRSWSRQVTMSASRAVIVLPWARASHLRRSQPLSQNDSTTSWNSTSLACRLLMCFSTSVFARSSCSFDAFSTRIASTSIVLATRTPAALTSSAFACMASHALRMPSAARQTSPTPGSASPAVNRVVASALALALAAAVDPVPRFSAEVGGTVGDSFL